MESTHDVAIVGGGPAGLAAALILGRSRRRVALLDAGPPRNAAATHVHGFVTQDGTPPREMRAIGRRQLAPYDVEILDDTRVDAIDGARDAFVIRTPARALRARRVVLATGMIDELPALPGLRELWGTSVVQCPYCHGWEVRDRRFGLLLRAPDELAHAPFFQTWSRDLVVFADGLPVDAGVVRDVEARGITVERRPVTALRGAGGTLHEIVVGEGAAIARDVLFYRPPQRQVPLVAALGLAVEPAPYVRVDDLRQTSVPGIYAAGDLTTMRQSAIVAAGEGSLLAYALNMDLAALAAH